MTCFKRATEQNALMLVAIGTVLRQFDEMRRIG